jgi:hypothetical protein
MPVVVRINPAELNKLSQDLKDADPKLVSALRKRIKTAGQVGVDAIRAALDVPPPTGEPDPSGFREALKAGTSTKVSFSRTGAGVKITTSSARLPADEKNLFAAFNRKRGYRVPLFGDRSRLTIQYGRPYFGAAVFKDSTLIRMNEEILKALDVAVDAIGGRFR